MVVKLFRYFEKKQELLAVFNIKTSRVWPSATSRRVRGR